MDKKETATVFYADDDRDDLDIFVEVAKDLNVTPHTYESADELIGALKNAPELPTHLFLDLNMPVKSGFEALSEIKAMPQFNEIPVIILSTASSENTVSKCEALGADLYICKPNS